MNFFTSQTLISTISRQLYVGNISNSTTVASSVNCYFRPLSEKQSSDNGYQYGIAHSCIFETDVDVREGDDLTIGGVVYTVRGVAIFSHGNVLDYTRTLVTKPQL